MSMLLLEELRLMSDPVLLNQVLKREQTVYNRRQSITCHRVIRKLVVVLRLLCVLMRIEGRQLVVYAWVCTCVVVLESCVVW